jgi:hypothetical protein
MSNEKIEKEQRNANIRSYCMPQKAVSISFCAIYWHLASRQNCINQSGTQHSAPR